MNETSKDNSTQDRYRLLIESISDYAIYMLDPQGRVISWNPGAERFKGYTEQEIVRQHFPRFYTEEDRASGLPARALRMAL
jgi:PAS domain S-box-containing protein